MMLHRKVVPYRPYEAQAGQLREIHAVSLVIWVIGPHIDTGLFYIERFKFQILMSKDMPERRQLTLCNIDDTDFRLPAGHPVADLFHTALLMLDNVLSAPVPIKIHQKIRDHIAGVSCQRKFFAIVVRRHRADQRSVFQNDFCIIAHRFPIGRDPQPSAAPLHQFSPQLFFQRGDHLADIGLRCIKAFCCLAEASFFTYNGKIL